MRALRHGDITCGDIETMMFLIRECGSAERALEWASAFPGSLTEGATILLQEARRRSSYSTGFSRKKRDGTA
jgi:hypothetical protein